MPFCLLILVNYFIALRYVNLRCAFLAFRLCHNGVHGGDINSAIMARRVVTTECLRRDDSICGVFGHWQFEIMKSVAFTSILSGFSHPHNCSLDAATGDLQKDDDIWILIL